MNKNILPKIIYLTYSQGNEYQSPHVAIVSLLPKK